MKKRIGPPFFEVGPKAYLYGEEALELARIAEEASRETGVSVIYTPQLTDLRLIRQYTEDLVLCAQHMDPIPVGRGQGSILPEALRAAGADAVMLNHCEKPMTIENLSKAISRAADLEMLSIACASSCREASMIALLHPDIIVVEPSELIGTGVTSDIDLVTASNQAVRGMDPHILVLQGAGISTPEDVYRVILAGADATGSSSAVCRARDPGRMLREMLRAAEQAYMDRKNREAKDKNGV
ncbi:MAG: triose-phosphate isomerase [Clostridia bacterium]|nr:triose-phosphate isomerase [Clostridia bacterium]